MNVNSTLPSTWSGTLHVALRVDDFNDGYEVRADLYEARRGGDETHGRGFIDGRAMYALSRSGSTGRLADLLDHVITAAVRDALNLFTLRRFLVGRLGFALFAADNDEAGQLPATLQEMWRLDDQAREIYEARAAKVLRWTEAAE